MSPSTGEILFSRYACSPNELGYCGPEVANAFEHIASGKESSIHFRKAASEFSGVWVYLEILGELLGRDPLDPELVRGYWIGNDLVDSVDIDTFWDKLIAVISARAGSYWKYLDDSLRAEAQPSHAFHVLGIYPWSRLLSTGRPEPVEVLTSCCIRPAVVTAVVDGVVEIDELTFEYIEGQLVPRTQKASSLPVKFNLSPAVGECVAVHWGQICDLLTPEEYVRLSSSLTTQLERVSHRLKQSP
ncbi:MAG: hypothetical protein KGM14_05975 [Actinomycetales bacterium]|nr:hypothetical protein [Actinomycetales bacterium]